MKKLNVILMALALVMGMTQCKKDNQSQIGNNTVLDGEEVQISLTLNSGAGNSTRSGVDPNDTEDIAPVHFSLGDVIWVAYNKRCVGSLRCDSLSASAIDDNDAPLGVFSGTITIDELSKPTPLYFYFLGNQTPYDVNNTTGWTAVGASQLTVSLEDQSGALPVISYGISEQPYSSTNSHYTVKYNWLKNQCALVKFTMENIYDTCTAMSTTNKLDQNPDAIYTTTKAITIYNMDNQVTVNLVSPGAADGDALWDALQNSDPNDLELDKSFTWDQKSGTNGAITLYSPSETEEVVRYAIVAPKTYTTPQGELSVPFNAAADDYGFFGTYRLVGKVGNNDYYQDAKLDLVWHSGAFSISGSQKVVFSRGNLQYADLQSGNRLASTWRFAKHQYDWVGGKVNVTGVNNYVWQGNVVLNEYDESSPSFSPDANNGNYRSDNREIGSTSGWIDLFGYNTGNRPTENDWHNNTYITSLDYSNNAEWAPYPAAPFADWGANYISNSGKPNDNTWWETLKYYECQYLFESRSCEFANADGMYGFADIQVSNDFKIHGLVVLPDNWKSSYNPTGVAAFKKANWTGATSSNGYWTTDCNVYNPEQWKTMESHGAIFLPAAGYRDHRDLTLVGYHETIFDGGYLQYRNRGTYYSYGVQGGDAAFGLGFGYASGDDLTGNHVNAKCGFAPDNGRSVRLVHRL